MLHSFGGKLELQVYQSVQVFMAVWLNKEFNAGVIEIILFYIRLLFNRLLGLIFKQKHMVISIILVQLCYKLIV